jgi:hypothetical protein
MGWDIESLTGSGDFVGKDYDILEPAMEKVVYYVVNIGLPPWLVSRLRL